MLNSTKIVLALREIDRFLDDRRGVTAVEYALIAALIGGALVGAVGAIGANANHTFTKISNGMTSVNAASSG